MTNTPIKRNYKLIFFALLVLGVVYVISTYAKKHEQKDLPEPTPKETPVNSRGN